MKLKIDIEKITVDHDVQVRESTNTEVINDYAEDFEKLPPIDVFYDGTTYWLSDGFHRIAAARKNRLKAIVCNVEDGGKIEAILHAAKANNTHGLRMSSKDKRRSVLSVLKVAPDWSDRRIADHAGVSHPLVAAVRAELMERQPVQVENSSTCDKPKRVGKDGKEYQAPVSKPKETEPVETVEPVVESTEPEVYDVWEEVDPPEPKESKVDQFRKLRSLVKQHANQMIRAVDDMQAIRCNPGTHKKLLGLFESIHSLVDGWPE